MVRYQLNTEPPHEVSILVLRHERHTEKKHLDKLKESLKGKLPTPVERREVPKSA